MTAGQSKKRHNDRFLQVECSLKWNLYKPIQYTHHDNDQV